MERRSKNKEVMELKSALTSIGAIGGIFYGVTKQKGFWFTAGCTLVFAIAGTVVGSAIDSYKK